MIWLVIFNPCVEKRTRRMRPEYHKRSHQNILIGAISTNFNTALQRSCGVERYFIPRCVRRSSNISQFLLLEWEQGKEWRARKHLAAVQIAYPNWTFHGRYIEFRVTLEPRHVIRTHNLTIFRLLEGYLAGPSKWQEYKLSAPSQFMTTLQVA